VAAGYVPSERLLCLTPKPGWLVRPGAVLNLEDEVIYTALLGALHERLWTLIGSSQGDPDVAYQLQPLQAGVEWVRSGFRVWTDWRTRSLAKLAGGCLYMVTADIAAFYDTIDLSLLFSDLRAMGADPTALPLLSACLNRWASPLGRGIPQGYTASDILAKLYLHPVDVALRNAGFTHLRYVDDIRIFCTSLLEAKRALLLMTEVLRRRGLNLQTAKTQIDTLEKAQRKVDGVTPTIAAIQKRLARETGANASAAGRYATAVEIDRALEGAPPETAAALERTFSESFEAADADQFDATLFHYVLNRLGKVRSRVATEFCIGLLRRRPEETEYVLRYLAAIGLGVGEKEQLVEYLASPDALYDYQLFQIVRWWYEVRDWPASLLPLCREWIRDRNRAPWLRAYSLALIGDCGDTADLEMLESLYASAATAIERAEVARALYRMERGRRNAFYGRVRGDGSLVGIAIDSAQSIS
jgi:hypothetical protein